MRHGPDGYHDSLSHIQDIAVTQSLSIAIRCHETYHYVPYGPFLYLMLTPRAFPS